MLNRMIKLAGASLMALGLLAAFSISNIPMRDAAKAAQGSGCLPTTGTVSGLTFAQGVNAAIAALISSNSGASAPATDCSAAAVKGQVWLDTSVTPNLLKQYDGTSWTVLGALDSANHLWSPPVGGGASSVSAASTTDLWASAASSITITGTTTINALANASAVPGTVKVVTVGGAFTLTHNPTSLELPSGGNIVAAVGDRFLAIAKSSSNVAVFAYTRADGSAIVNPSVPLGTVLYGDYGTIPPKTVYGAGQALSRASYPAYLAAVTRAQTGTLTAGNNTITSVANTAGLGAGMPLEGTGIQAGTTISSVTSSTIVMSQTATTNGAQSVTAFVTGYGAGGDSTTVGVKDCRGRTLAGRDDLLGSPANRLTSSYFGTAATRIGASGGSEKITLQRSDLPNASVTVTITDPGHRHEQTVIPAVGFQGGGNAGAIGGSGSYTSTVFTGITASFNLNGNVSQTLPPIVQPTIIAECVVVVLP